jgi:hypothetical protein
METIYGNGVRGERKPTYLLQPWDESTPVSLSDEVSPTTNDITRVVVKRPSEEYNGR